jgi:hypothetical protein
MTGIQITPQQTAPTCYQCGSKLLFISKKTEKLPNSFSSTVVTIYRCSNIECQEEKDKQEVIRQKAQKEKEERLALKKKK